MNCTHRRFSARVNKEGEEEEEEGGTHVDGGAGVHVRERDFELGERGRPAADLLLAACVPRRAPVSM
jgi:hypothetical protein